MRKTDHDFPWALACFTGVVLLIGCSGTSGPPASTGPSRVAPRRRPAVTAGDPLRSVQRALRKAIRQKGSPRLEAVLGGTFKTIPRECRGQLRTDLGLHVIPGKHPRLPTAKLQPGVIFALKGLTPAPRKRPQAPKRPAAQRPPPRRRAAKPELEEGLCAVTVTPGIAGRQAALQLVPVPMGSSTPVKISFEWQEFPPGNVLLSVVEVGPEDRSTKGEVSSSTTVGLIRYHAGRFKMLTGYHRKVVNQTGDSKHTVTTRLKLVTLGRPPRYLIVRIYRSVTVLRTKEPVEMGDPSHGTTNVVMRGVTMTTLSESYGILTFSSSLDEIDEVMGPAHQALLKHPGLAPYRKNVEKTTKKWDQDD